MLDEQAAVLIDGAPIPLADSAVSSMTADTKLAAKDPLVPSSALDRLDEESTAHKAKRLATEAGHKVQEAVTQGLEAASSALHSVKAQVDEKIADHSAKSATVTKAPYNMKNESGPVQSAPTTASASTTLATGPQEPGVLDQTKAALSHAADVVMDAAHSAMASAEQAFGQVSQSAKSSGLVDKAKVGATNAAASVQSGVNQLGAAIKGATGSEISRQKDLGVSDASHSQEKADGSLPMERNADEFPHPRAQLHETAAHSKLGAGIDSEKVVVDKPISMDSGLAKTDNQPDLLTGPNPSLAAI